MEVLTGMSLRHFVSSDFGLSPNHSFICPVIQSELMPQGRSASHSRLTPFLRGVIYGLFLGGLTIPEIQVEIVKGDGECPSYNAVAVAIKQCIANGGTRESRKTKKKEKREKEEQRRITNKN